MKGQMRLEQQMKLAPHMIQSMEILQLPILALQERIEQELSANPVLEAEQISQDFSTADQQPDSSQQMQPDTAADSYSKKDDDFDRIGSLDGGYSDYIQQAQTYRKKPSADAVDKKLEAIKNTAAPSQSLHDYLADQWRFIETEPSVTLAGYQIIDYIDPRGYLTVHLEQLHNSDKKDFSIDDINTALSLIQQLEPLGVGARDIKECLLIQMTQSPDDLAFEIDLIQNHIDDLLNNKLPDIARKMKCPVERINKAIEKIGRFDTSPGLQIGPDLNVPVTPDIIVEESENQQGFSVRLADNNSPVLRISDDYIKMAKDPDTNEKTRKFLNNNLRSAQWIIDAVAQRNSTLLKVASSIVNRQTDFFEKGKFFLKPLPMAKVAEDVKVHVATVSRAVAGKYLQCSWGILPLRKFFSGGTEDTDGISHSWEAVRAKLQLIIDNEDKAKPFSDIQIQEKLAALGINNIARRTVAKYRKLMSIPAARFRKKF